MTDKSKAQTKHDSDSEAMDDESEEEDAMAKYQR